MLEKNREHVESKPGKEDLHPGEFSELGSLDPNVDQTLMRLSGTV